MQLRWTGAAVADLERITNYLLEHTDLAPELVRAIQDAPEALLSFPYRGRPGKKAGTHELVMSRLPWIVVYRITGNTIQILRILHGAQKWP